MPRESGASNTYRGIRKAGSSAYADDDRCAAPLAVRLVLRALGRRDRNSVPVFVEALAHFLAGLEERHRLLVDGDMRAGARIAARARRTMLHRERAETAQFDTVTARHRRRDLGQNRVDDVLDVALIKMRILGGDALDQFRLDHVAAHFPVTVNREGAKALADRQDLVSRLPPHRPIPRSDAQACSTPRDR